MNVCLFEYDSSRTVSRGGALADALPVAPPRRVGCRMLGTFVALASFWTTSMVSMMFSMIISTAVLAAEPVQSERVISEAKPTDLRATMIEDLKFLTSESLQGRSSIDPSILEAAEFIAERFRKLGLKTDLYEGSPLQFLEITIGPKVGAVEKNFLQVSRGNPNPGEAVANQADAATDDDFNPLAIGTDEASVSGELVFVGYGIRAPEHSYDEYAGIDVQNKIVMLLRKEPGAADPDSPFDGTKNSRHAFFETKVATAIDAGAAAVLIINDPASVQQMVAAVQSRRDAEVKRLDKIRERLSGLPAEAVNARERLATQITRIEDMLLAMEDQFDAAGRGLIEIGGAGLNARRGSETVRDAASGEDSTRPPVPVLSISRQFAAGLLSQSLETIETQIDADYQPRSMEIPGVTLRMGVELSPSTVRSPNVVGVLPGRGTLAEETLVIGAHYDHVGLGGYGSLAPGTIAVHNGADDNASGTATLLRVAARLTGELNGPNPPADHRRIVFIAFTGEERGLLGSKHYVDQPRFPVSSTVAMVNMDMVGRLKDNELTVYGTGSAPPFDELVEQVNEQTQFSLVKVPGGYGPSDHASFYEAGIPVLFFFTGLHSDYHRPSDDFEKLNLDGMGRITDMITTVSQRLATVPERPVYVKTEDGFQIRRQLTVFLGVQMSQQPSVVVLSSILAGGPADQGGLLADDRIIKVGEQPIATIEEFMDNLRQRSPGDVLPVIVSRDAEELKFEIKLRPR